MSLSAGSRFCGSFGVALKMSPVMPILSLRACAPDTPCGASAPAATAIATVFEKVRRFMSDPFGNYSTRTFGHRHDLLTWLFADRQVPEMRDRSGPDP